MFELMFAEAQLMVLERRPRAYRKQSQSAAPSEDKARAARPSRAKGAGAADTASQRVPRPPEGWPRRLREQGNNLARAIGMLEQAMSMMTEPRPNSLARAECLRGAALLTMVAASELLVISGWFEADQAVRGGSLDI